VEPLSAGQTRTVAGVARQTARFLESLKHRIDREVLRENPAVLQTLYRLTRQVQPDGRTQERILNPMAFSGPRPELFFDRILAAAESPDPDTRTLVW
jgi:uncharacterized protein YllA (UPF0747 family)